MRKVKRKAVGYPPLPKGKRGVKRKLFGGKEARRARRAERQEDRQERRTARQEARQQAKEEGVGLFGRLRAGFQAGREVREQQQLEDMQPDPNEVTETDPAMTGAVGGGVDTSAAGVGMDTGGGAAKRGGLRDRRRRRKQNGGMFEMSKKEQDKAKVEVIKGTRTKKETREAKRDERRIDRKIKRYKRVGERRKKSDRQGAGEVGLDRYREKLQNRAKRKRKRKARRQKVRDFGSKVKAASQARRTARRNRRKEQSNSGSGCQGAGCGAYE